MDGRLKYSRIQKLVISLDDKKDYHLDELKLLIRMHIATSEPAVVETVHQLVSFGFMKEVGPFKFRVLQSGNL